MAKKTTTKKKAKNTVKKAKVTKNKADPKIESKKNPSAIEVTIEKRVLGEVPERFHFYLNDGRKLKNIYELIDALDEMSDEVFKYHVNEDKNDFASWIQEVMEEASLADDIRKVENKVEAQLKLLKHVVNKLR